jgi:hypothetical protein
MLSGIPDQERVARIEIRLKTVVERLTDLQDLLELARAEIGQVLCVPLWVLYEMQLQVRNYQIMIEEFQILWNHKLGPECGEISEEHIASKKELSRITSLENKQPTDKF